jgi:uncharacterized protein (DUF433 family)
MLKMKIQEILTTNPQIQFGTPVFKNTRVPAAFLFDFLEDGLSIEQFLAEFPSVQYRQVVALLEITGNLLQSPKIIDIYESVA